MKYLIQTKKESKPKFTKYQKIPAYRLWVMDQDQIIGINRYKNKIIDIKELT